MFKPHSYSMRKKRSNTFPHCSHKRSTVLDKVRDLFKKLTSSERILQTDVSKLLNMYYSLFNINYSAMVDFCCIGIIKSDWFRKKCHDKKDLILYKLICLEKIINKLNSFGCSWNTSIDNHAKNLVKKTFTDGYVISISQFPEDRMDIFSYETQQEIKLCRNIGIIPQKIIAYIKQSNIIEEKLFNNTINSSVGTIYSNIDIEDLCNDDIIYVKLIARFIKAVKNKNINDFITTMEYCNSHYINMYWLCPSWTADITKMRITIHEYIRAGGSKNLSHYIFNDKDISFLQESNKKQT